MNLHNMWFHNYVRTTVKSSPFFLFESSSYRLLFIQSVTVYGGIECDETVISLTVSAMVLGALVQNALLLFKSCVFHE